MSLTPPLPNFIPGQSKAFAYEVTVAPAEKALELTTVKDYLKIPASVTNHDDILNLMIDIVTQVAEDITKRDFINKTWTTYRDFFPRRANRGFLIRRSKMHTVNSIKYLVDDVPTTFDSSKYFITKSNSYSTIMLKSGEEWPSDLDERADAIEIQFVSGFGAGPSNIPEDLRGGMLQHIAAFFENRGDCSLGDCEKALPGETRMIYELNRIVDISFHQTIG
jgi:uncharacterized phiE125 gp8 family phage protein